MYYIREGIILSDKKTEVEFTNIDSNHDFSSEDTKSIVKILESTLTNKREIKINGIIEDFNTLKTKLESNNKKGFKKVKDDNYDFIGKTSSILILKQMIKQEEDQTTTKDFKTNILSRVHELKGIEDKKLSTIETELLKANKAVRDKESEIQRLEEEMKTLGSDEIIRKTNQISKIEEEKNEFEKKLDSFDNPSLSEREEELTRKSQKFRDKLEDNELEIKFIEEKIKLLIRKKKFGKERHLNPISMVLTLGLIYWSKYSEIDYHIAKLQLKIANKKEKSLKFMKSITKIEREITRSDKNKKDELIKKAKEIEKIKDRIEKSDVKINNLNKEINQLQKDLRPKINKREKLENELRVLQNERDLVEESKKEILKHSTQRIRDLLAEIDNSRKAELKLIKELKETLESQKTTIKGDWIVE